jgi:hypothetical protein
MSSNQDNDQDGGDQDGGRGQRYAKIGGGAVATGLFVAALVFGVYSITSTGADDGPSENPSAADAPAEPAEVVDVEDPSEAESSDDLLIDLNEDDDPDGDPTTDPADLVDAVPAFDPVGLSSFCVNVEHGDGASGIWVRGEVYGLDGGWIWVEAETVNGGEPVQIPVESGVFDSPLPIRSYGDHEVTRFELVADGPDTAPVDLMPALLDGPGAIFPVGPDEGPIFESECFDIEPVASVDGVADTPEVSEAALVDQFLDGFIEDHRTGDAEGLLSTLHPEILRSFGEDVCTEYVNRTTGSITDATVVDVGQIGSLELDSPAGLIEFPEAIPFTVEFTVTDGGSVTNAAHLPLNDGTVHWLTTCGVDVP